MVSLSDIVGSDDFVAKIRENIILPNKNKTLTSSNRVVIYGPPGCGKTFVAKAIAGELNLGFAEIKSTESEEEIKEKASSLPKTSLLFIDEIDKIIGKLPLAEIPKVNLVIGATNKPWDITSLRNRGFSAWVFLPEPGKKARKAIIQQCLKRKNEKIDLDALADVTRGYTPSEIHEIIKKANFENIYEEFKKNPQRTVKDWRKELKTHTHRLDKETFKPLFDWL